MDKTFQCWVPVLDGRPLINAVGVNKTESHVNMDLIELSDEEVNRATVVQAELKVDIEAQDSGHSVTLSSTVCPGCAKTLKHRTRTCPDCDYEFPDLGYIPTIGELSKRDAGKEFHGVSPAFIKAVIQAEKSSTDLA